MVGTFIGASLDPPRDRGLGRGSQDSKDQPVAGSGFQPDTSRSGEYFN